MVFEYFHFVVVVDGREILILLVIWTLPTDSSIEFIILHENNSNFRLVKVLKQKITQLHNKHLNSH